VPRPSARRRAALLLLLLALPLTTRAQSASADGERGADRAEVVLIGQSGESAELRGVLSELLQQEGVQAELVAEPRFDRRALLDANAGDQRVWIFVALENEQRARLYFRGPYGERFLLRELSLRAGLDEVGRELIARVVQSGAVALLRSHEGLSRAEAEVEVARVAAQNPEAQAEPAAEAESQPTAAKIAVADDDEGDEEPSFEQQERGWLIGVRVVGAYTGRDLGARLGAGIEAGVLALHGPSARLRVRLALEPSLPQAIDGDGIEAHVLSWPLRLGLDLGWSRRASAFWLAVSTGGDFVRVSTQRASDPSLSLSKPDSYLRPASRVELRYELAVDRVLLGAALLLDIAWSRSHYDVIADGERAPVAEPWQLRPGLALGAALSF